MVALTRSVLSRGGRGSTRSQTAEVLGNVGRAPERIPFELSTANARGAAPPARPLSQGACRSSGIVPLSLITCGRRTLSAN